jgi:hypothetical protein
LKKLRRGRLHRYVLHLQTDRQRRGRRSLRSPCHDSETSTRRFCSRLDGWTQPIIKSADMSEEVSPSRIRPRKRTSDDARLGRLADPSTVRSSFRSRPTRRQMQKVAIQVATEAMAAENAEEKDVRMRRPFPSTQLATLSGDCLRLTARTARLL